MAASFFNRLAGLGVGVAAVGGVVNTALYNGKKSLFTVVEVSQLLENNGEKCGEGV